MATLIDGRALAARIESEVANEIRTLAPMGVVPSLVSLQVGSDPASSIYARRQERMCARHGIGFRHLGLPAATTERQVLRELEFLNASPEVTGILLQMPLPAHLNARSVRRALSPGKDVEGVHPENLGGLLSGRRDLVPCTAAAAFECLIESGIRIEGATAVVIGHSETVGKPIALLLMERLATVTVCHHGTLDLPRHTKNADIVVVAVGKPGLLQGDLVKTGVVVIDVGINEIHKGGDVLVVGDADAATVGAKASYLTPVPGGVGPVTVAMLLRNTVRAAMRQVSI